jgi:hypothetical protein
MAISHVFEHPLHSPQRLEALKGLDPTDVALAAVVVVEEHRAAHGLTKRDHLGRDLAGIVAASRTDSVTHHVAALATASDVLGHLTVQYAKIIHPDLSFKNALGVPDEHLSILARHYALWMANNPSKWDGRHPWSADDMIQMIPFLSDETALFTLATQVRVNLCSAAMLRYAEVVDQETLEFTILHIPFAGFDKAWTQAASRMSQKARTELAFREHLSFTRRKAMQSTLPTSVLVENLDKVPANVRLDIQEVLASREQ